MSVPAKIFRFIGPLLGLLLLTSSCAPTIDFLANSFFLPNQGIREAIFSVTTERQVGFTTKDGIDLLADIHHPQGLEKTPTILVRIPFTNTLKNRVQSDVISRYWASRGYTVVIQGTRGRYESGGTFYPLRHEQEDGIETLNWLTTQPWYNGRLAMWGGSAFGHTQLAIADQKDPGIDALFIQIASTNFRRMFYPGNAFSLESAVYWAIRSRGTEDREVDYQDLINGVNTLPLIEADDRAIGDTDFFNDWLLNQDNDEYWKSIDGQDRAQTVQAPTLLLGGWFDPFLPTQINDFTTMTTKGSKRVRTETRLIIGPWGHANSINIPGHQGSLPYRVASIEPSIPWFDHQLGLSKGPLDFPRVKIFVMGENRWRNENEWPLARTQYTSFYLHSNGSANTQKGDGRLDTVKPKDAEPSDTYIYDPLDPTPSFGGAMLGDRSGMYLQNAVETRPDVLVFTTPQLSTPIEVTGPIQAILYVETDVPSTDFTVKLVDVYPDGSAYNLSDGILRRDYPTKLEKMPSPVRIEISLWPTSNVFLKDHQIRVEISSSNFPRYDRNPNTGEFIPKATKTSIASQKIYHSAQYPSQLRLPIIP
jgi:uncharacterized protein